MNNPATFSGVISVERGEILIPPPPRCIPSRNRGVYLGPASCGNEINATFVFSSPCLCASSEAGGESSFESGYTRGCGWLNHMDSPLK